MAEKGETWMHGGMMFYYRLHKIMIDRDLCSISNNFESWLSCLDRLFMCIEFEINKKDRDEIAKLIEEAEKKLYPETQDATLMSEYRQANSGQIRKSLKKLDMTISRAMDKKKMIIPRIEGEFGLSVLEKKYGLTSNE
jgi:hypothetical protein